MSALDGNIDEATILFNAYLEEKKTRDYEEANKLKMHCIRRAEAAMPPIDLKGSVATIKYYLSHRNRNEAIKGVQDLIEALESVKTFTEDQIYTSYPITGPKNGTLADQWPSDCSSIILPPEEA